MSSDAPAHRPVTRLRRGSWRDPAVLLVTGFGSGFLRPAPGTWGSIVALALWWFLLAGLAWPWQLLTMGAVFVGGGLLTSVVGRRYGVHDDPGIVVDEFVGLWLTLLAVPAAWHTALAGFVVFRTIDILKPWPVSWADRRIPGAFGVMIDDVMAGGLAAGVLQLAFLVLGWPPSNGAP